MFAQWWRQAARAREVGIGIDEQKEDMETILEDEAEDEVEYKEGVPGIGMGTAGRSTATTTGSEATTEATTTVSSRTPVRTKVMRLEMVISSRRGAR